MQSFQILHKSALKTFASFQESRINQQHKAFQHIKLFNYQSHSTRSSAAHLRELFPASYKDELNNTAQDMQLKEPTQLRQNSRWSATLPSSTTLHRPCSLGINSARAIQLANPPVWLEKLSHAAQDVLFKSQTNSATSPLGHSARSHAAHLDEFIYSGQVKLPEESDQLRLHCHLATLPFGLSARSHAAHLDEFVYSGQVTLPEESDQLRLHCHLATSPFGLSARSHAAHLDEFVYFGQVTLPEE